MNKITLDAFTKYKFLSKPTFSDGGKRFVFEVTNISEDKKSYETGLFELENNNAKRITTKSGQGFCFLNEDEIIFRDDRDKSENKSAAPSTKIYKLNLNGGEAEKFLEFDSNLSIVDVVGNKIIFIESYNPIWDGYDKTDSKSREAMVSRNKDDEDYHVFDEIPFWGNGAGVTNKNRSRLACYDLGKKELTFLTEKERTVELVDINKNTEKIAFTTNVYKDKMPLTSEVMMLDLRTGKIEDITPLYGMSYQILKFMGDDIITLATDMKSHGINENGSLILFEPNEKRILKKVMPDFSFWSSVGSDVRYREGDTFKVDGDYFYFTTTIEYKCELFRIDKNLEIEQLTNCGGSVDSFDVKNGKIYAVSLIEQKLQELYEIKDGEHIEITHLNDGLKDVYVAKPELVEWDKNDYHYTGFVLLPPNYDATKKYPAVFEIHGGPKTVYGTVFYHELQFLANEGYIVFFTNPRGSDGYGNDFMDIFGKYGDVDYKDLMDFTDLVLEKYPAIDKDRVFVTGGSYGGFMTNWIIGHTNRFKRACSQRSISNWISMWGTADIGYYFADDQTRAAIWNNVSGWGGVDKMWEQSPLKYADKVETPTLFINSNEDYRCYHTEGLQMFTALKYFGVESRLVLFKGENHELSRSGLPHHRIRRLTEIRDWFKLGL